MSPIEKSRYVAEFLPCKDFSGRDIIAFIVKRTYELDPFAGHLRPLEEQPPVLVQDEPFDDGDTDTPSVRLEADFAPPFKPKADVVVLGKAYAPGGEPVPEFFCGIRIGAYSKRLRIVGPRHCVYVPPRKEPKIDKKTGQPKEVVVLPPPLFTDPEPVRTVELRMQNAYGGMSYLVPNDPEAFEKAVEDAKQAEVEAEKKKAEKATQKRAEEAKAEAAEAAAPERFFAGDGAGKDARADDGTQVFDPSLALGEEPAEEPPPKISLDDWGQVGTAGERPPSARDGATKAIDLSEIEGAAATEGAYRDHVGAGAPAGDEADAPATEGGTRVFEIGRMVETKDPDWAGRERDRLSAADRARREAEEKARKERAAAEALPWPRIACPQNPVGKGFALGNLVETVDGLALPLIEDPDHPIVPEAIPRDLTKLLDESEAILPAGLGVFPKTWWPRALKSGVMPHEQAATAEIVDEYLIGLDPEDDEQRAIAEGAIDFEAPVMRPEYYSVAPGGLQVDELVGDEEVLLENLDENGKTVFRLPGDYPLVTLDRGAGREPVPVRLDTVIIDREEARVSLVWRGALPYGGIAEFETYLRFDIDVDDTDVRAYREERERLELTRRAKDGATRAVDTSALASEGPAEEAYRAHVARGTAESEGDDTPAVVEGGTRVIDLADQGEEKVVDDAAFDGWVDGAKRAETEELDEAALRKQKKEALRKRLAELKAKEAAAAEDSD